MARDDDTKRAATSKLDFHRTDEEQLQFDVAIAHDQFKENPSSCFFPFWALSRIYAYHIQTQDDASEISLPTWVIEALFCGFMSYDDAISDGSGKSLGEAFGLEGGRQGSHRVAKRHQKSLRDIQICIEIALAEEQGIKIEAAVQHTADLWGISPTSTRDIWAENADHARTSLKNFRSDTHS